jgi:hypothetical protein
MKVSNQIRSQVLKLTHAIIRNHGWNFSDAQKQAWKIFRLKAEMRTGHVPFTYMKKDGTIRQATGTLDVVYKAKRKPSSGRTSAAVKYFDLEKNAWRSFQAINFTAA